MSNIRNTHDMGALIKYEVFLCKLGELTHNGGCEETFQTGICISTIQYGIL